MGEMIVDRQVGGIVLCGGKSKRMGSPKAWLPFGDERLLQRVVRTLLGPLDHLAVVAAPDQNLPPLPPDVILTRDSVAGKGPLQGLATGMAALSGRVEAAYVSSCDVPFLQPAFVRHLIGLLEDDDIVIPKEGEFYHPLAAVYRTSVLPAAETLLRHGRLRIIYLFEECRVRAVPVEDLRVVDPDLRSLQNVNSLEDYRAALEAAGLSDWPNGPQRLATVEPIHMLEDNGTLNIRLS